MTYIRSRTRTTNIHRRIEEGGGGGEEVDNKMKEDALKKLREGERVTRYWCVIWKRVRLLRRIYGKFVCLLCCVV